MDLTSLMRSPDLALEPPPGVADAARRRARRVRRRRQAAGAVLGVAALLGAGTLVPRGEPVPQELASSPDYGIRTATSDVLRLERLNGADVVAWFEGDELCVAAIRVKRSRSCAPGVDPATTATLPHVFPLDADALRVDDRQLVAGLARADIATVRAHFAGGPVLQVPVRRARGFRLPVFWFELPDGARLVRLAPLGADGAERGERLFSPAAR